LMIAMTHVRQVEKPDRDPTQAQLAEFELTRMIESYPDSPLLDEAKQKLREVQEILAEGVFKIGNHYFIRKALAAATGRYREVLEKYPDYSQTPEVLFNMGKALREADNPESAIYFGMIVSNYPYSEQVGPAKQELMAMNRVIPEPNPAALQRGQPVREEKGIFGKFFGSFGRRPNINKETNASSVSVKEEEKKNESKDEEKDQQKNQPDNSRDKDKPGSFTIKPAKKPQ
jgi:hypothetical protein